LVPALVREMGQHFGELERAEALITETLKLEEARFNRTLDRGLKLLEEETARLGAGEALAGAVAFKLYDTYGFPLDLTQDILRGQGRGVDQAGFDAAMARQRAAARKSWVGSGEAATEGLWYELRERHGATEFLGYQSEKGEGQVQAILVDARPVEAAEAGQAVQLLVNQTPFYGESGGQMGDSGVAFTATGAEVRIDDTQKRLGDLHVHIGEVVRGRLAVGDAVELSVASERRAGLRAHHSATHLLHEALRRRLGEHVTQKGSLVAPDRLRFDFSHPAPLTQDDVAAIEAMVNARIRANAETATHYMTPDEAVAAGALALFGEKYGEEVRVVSMGGPDEAKGHDATGQARAFSTELCGGTHVGRTGDIGFFKITGESALAAGVRRIEAVAGAAAVEQARSQHIYMIEASAIAGARPDALPARIEALVEDRKRLERELSDLRRKLATGGGDDGPKERDVGGVKFAARLLSDVPPRDLKPMADALKTRVGSGVVALVSVVDGKASLVVGVTDDLTGRVSAVDLVRAGSAALGGKGGGGRPDMAQAGGPDGAAAQAALNAIEERLAAL
ncbi:MAG TPA: alanine--tRNA ligase-related protein, partial [Kiloniellales bacterium]